MKIYFGSPLFTESQRMFNTATVTTLRGLLPENVEIYLPQENGDINDKSKVVHSTEIFKQDTDELVSSQAMIAILDGQDIDSGLASELGIAYSEGIPIYALYSDIRHQPGMATPLEFGETPVHYINQYVMGLIKASMDTHRVGGLYTNSSNLYNDLYNDVVEGKLCLSL